MSDLAEIEALYLQSRVARLEEATRRLLRDLNRGDPGGCTEWPSYQYAKKLLEPVATASDPEPPTPSP